MEPVVVLALTEEVCVDKLIAALLLGAQHLLEVDRARPVK